MTSWTPAAAALGAALLWACGPDPKQPVVPQATAAASASASASAAAGGPQDIPDGQRVGSEKLVDRRHATALAPDTLDSVKSVSTTPPKSAAEIYRAVAPATVIVRVPNGMGSGVIIDKAGWVLTNHHVIAQGKSEDFKVTVSIMLGDLSAETKSMERQDKSYEAQVYKADKLRDIALLKIEDPPKNLTAVPIARDLPSPGEEVTALGHAGAGMLWAIKPGRISALGKLAEHLATLAQFKDDEEGRKAKKAFQQYVNSKNLGMVIQSTCTVLPGDSGGPLVNSRGQLVGLNAFSKKDQQTGGLLNFHVHLAEIRKFMKQRPSKPARLLPDPWHEGGGDMRYEDVDLDGQVDVVLMQGRRPCQFCQLQSAAVLMDIDQSSFAGASSLPDLQEVFDKRSFDAEAVFLRVLTSAFVWYDTDNDGRHDVLIYDEGTTGHASAYYRILPDGDLQKDEALGHGKLFRSSLFADEALRERFARVAQAAFPPRFFDALTAFAATLPEPIGATGRAELKDLNNDGQADAVAIANVFSNRLVIDADQTFAPSLPPTFELAETKDRSSWDPEVVLVSQGTHMWMWYDTDNDGRLDLALHSPGLRTYVALEAWQVDERGTKTEAPEHVGRKLVRPGLLAAGAELENGLRSMVGSGLLAIMSSKDDGLGSFPDPIADHRGAGFELANIRGATKGVVTIVGQGSDGYLIDLDGNSRLLGLKPDIEKVVEDGKFDAEFAYFQRNGVAWAYYDSQGSGSFDVVLVALQPAGGKATAGFRIDKQNRTTLDAALADTPLIRHSLFRSKQQQKRFQGWVKELFAENMLEK